MTRRLVERLMTSGELLCLLLLLFSGATLPGRVAGFTGVGGRTSMQRGMRMSDHDQRRR